MKPVWKRLLLLVAVLLGSLSILAALGYLYLRNSTWWTTLTLFSDETRVENFQNFHTLFPSDPIDPGDSVWAFESDLRPLPEFYTFEGQQRSMDEFLERTWTTGFAVAKDDELLYEAYFSGYGPDSLPTSFSVAKPFVSALVGIAIEQGYIASVWDPVEMYVPALAGTGYGPIPLQHLLTMSSGVEFDEDYRSSSSDVNMIPVRVFVLRASVTDLMKDVAVLREPGTYNDYASSDTLVLGLVLQAATGQSLAQFMEQTIWKPAGMERPAYWGTDLHGNTLAYGFLSASLRDYLRFGRLYLNQGLRDGQRIIPAAWIDRSVNPQEAHLQPGDNPQSHSTFGYGYQWWIPDNPQGDFTAIGIWGQYVYVHPGYGVVIIKTSADYDFDTREHETIAVFRALAQWASEQ
jgi:CubicO group peptidase (beta-lactamase class C family)